MNLFFLVFLLSQHHWAVRAVESTYGISGYRDAQEELEKVSGSKREIDERNERLLQEYSEKVIEFQQKIKVVPCHLFVCLLCLSLCFCAMTCSRLLVNFSSWRVRLWQGIVLSFVPCSCLWWLSSNPLFGSMTQCLIPHSISAVMQDREADLKPDVDALQELKKQVAEIEAEYEERKRMYENIRVGYETSVSPVAMFIYFFPDPTQLSES